MSDEYDFDNMSLDDMRQWIEDLHRRAETQRRALILSTLILIGIIFWQGVLFAKAQPENLSALLLALFGVIILVAAFLVLAVTYLSS